MHNSLAAGHLAAMATILMWGLTYISMKVLLDAYTPVEILFWRYLIGFALLFAAAGLRIRFRPLREEWLYAAAGCSGITFFSLLENMALTYTYASNVAMIMAVAPMLTGLLARVVLLDRTVGGLFAVGVFCAAAGIGLISYSGAEELHLNPFGDLLAVAGAVLWAVYSLFTQKITAFGEKPAEATCHIFFYGLLSTAVLAFFLPFQLDVARFADPVNLVNILFLGVLASALCFALWTFCVEILGAARTVVYVYATPLVTLVCAALILGEVLTPRAMAGIVLIMTGLCLSQWRRKRPEEAL